MRLKSKPVRWKKVKTKRYIYYVIAAGAFAAVFSRVLMTFAPEVRINAYLLYLGAFLIGMLSSTLLEAAVLGGIYSYANLFMLDVIPSSFSQLTIMSSLLFMVMIILPAFWGLLLSMVGYGIKAFIAKRRNPST